MSKTIEELEEANKAAVGMESFKTEADLLEARERKANEEALEKAAALEKARIEQALRDSRSAIDATEKARLAQAAADELPDGEVAKGAEQAPLYPPGPPTEASIEVLKELIGEMGVSGVGAPIEGGGTFRNTGYVIKLKYTTAHIGIDGWIEVYPKGASMIRVPIRIQDLMTLAQAAGGLARAGHIAQEHEG